MRELTLNKQKVASRNRFKRQRRKIDFRGLLKKSVRLVAAVVVVSLVGLIGYGVSGFISRTTFLRLERIEVAGVKRLTRDEVISLSTARSGDDMLGLKLRQMGEHIGKNPWVARVQIRRTFPNTLTIAVQEREPVAVINMGFLYYVDGQGEVFKPLTVGDSLDYPILTGFSEEEMAKDPSGSRDGVRAALGLIGLLRNDEKFNLAEVSEIHFDKVYGFTLFTQRSGVPVKLGNSDFPAKLQRLARIYRDLQKDLPLLEYVDLDYADRIIVKKA